MLPGMMSGYVSDWLGYKLFFIFVLVAAIPAFLMTWFVPFTDAKYGMTRAQIAEAFTRLSAMGAKEFGIHAFLASNTTTDDYYPTLAMQLFRLAVELHEETGAHIGFINLSGGVGIPYRPDGHHPDILAIGEGVRKVYEQILVPAGMGDVPRLDIQELIPPKVVC